VAASAVTQNGGTYFMAVTAAGAYYVTEEYVADPGADSQPNGNYAVGSFVQNSDGTCQGQGSGPNGFGAAINISGATNSNLSFNNSCQRIAGFSGILNYTGGSIGNNGQIYIEAVQDNGTDNEQAPSQNTHTNGGTYNLQVGGSGSYYLRVWYDSTGNSCGGNGCNPLPGDPWDVYGPFTPNAGSPAVNLNFPGDLTWPVGGTATPTPTPGTGYSISGSVSYTGSLASVSSGDPIVVLCSNSSNLGVTQYVAYSTINSAIGSYNLAVPSPGNYYVIAFVGTSNPPQCQDFNLSCIGVNVSTQGALEGAYGGGSLTPINVTGGSTGINFSFDDTNQETGVSGGVTYTGSLGGVSNTHPIVILDYSDPGYTQPDEEGGPREIDCNSTTYSYHVPSGDYYLAFYDLQGNGTLSSGDPYVELGAITPSTTATQNILFGDSNLWAVAATPTPTPAP